MTTRSAATLGALTLAVLASGLGLRAQADLQSLDGWWMAEARENEQSTPVYLHLTTEDGKSVARVTVPEIQVWEFLAGEATLDQHGVKVAALDWTLEFDAVGKRLHGSLPAGLVPVYRIPVEFHPSAPPERPPARTFSAPAPTIRWSRTVNGPVWAGLETDARGRLFVATDRGQVSALDAKSGSVAWTFDTSGPVRARPHAAGHHVYVSSDDGYLYKLHASTGRQVWRTKIDAAGKARSVSGSAGDLFDRYASSAVEHNGRAYVGSRDGFVYALDAATGTERWRFRTGDLVVGTPTVWRDLIVVGSFDHYVYALKASDGSLVWKHDTLGAITSDVIVDRGLALVGNRAYDLAAYDAATGRPAWRRYVWFSWVESIPTVRDGVAFVGSSDALKFFAVDGATGAPVWTAPMPGWSWSRPVVTDRYACLGAVGTAAESDGHDGGYLCLDRRTGNPQFTLKGSVAEGKGEWGFASSGVWIAGTFYAADLSGTVWAFSDGAETTKGRGSRPRPHDSQTPRD